MTVSKPVGSLGAMLTLRLGKDASPATIDWANRMSFVCWSRAADTGKSEMRLRWRARYSSVAGRVVEPPRGTCCIPARQATWAQDVAHVLERVVIPRVTQEILRDPDYYLDHDLQIAIYRYCERNNL